MMKKCFIKENPVSLHVGKAGVLSPHIPTLCRTQTFGITTFFVQADNAKNQAGASKSYLLQKSL